MTLPELKARAIALGLTKDDVRQFGNLSYKTTWEAAIAQAETAPPPVDEPPAGEPTSTPTGNAIATEVVPDGEWLNNQCTLIKQHNPLLHLEDVILVSGACDGIEEPIAYHCDATEARRIANRVKLTFGQQIVIRASDGNYSGIHRRHEDEIDPDTLPELKKTDDRFESWTPWMKAGAQFTTPRGNRFTIIGVDKWGNCHAIADGDDAPQTFRLETLTRCCPEADGDTRDEVIEQFRAAGVSDADIAQLKAAPLSATGASMILGVLQGLTGPLPVSGVVVGLILTFFALG